MLMLCTSAYFLWGREYCGSRDVCILSLLQPPRVNYGDMCYPSLKTSKLRLLKPESSPLSWRKFNTIERLGRIGLSWEKRRYESQSENVSSHVDSVSQQKWSLESWWRAIECSPLPLPFGIVINFSAYNSPQGTPLAVERTAMSDWLKFT